MQEEKKEEEKIMPETVDINRFPIFSTGKWDGKNTSKGGEVFTESDLDDIVATFQNIGDKVKPRLILGHDKKKSEDFSGYPALGWFTKVYREGKELFGDIKAVPKKIKDMIDKKGYGRVSPGIWRSMYINGQMFNKVLDHVALLGATVPANTDLDGFIDLYDIDNNENLIRYYNKKEVVDMDQLQELSKKIVELTAKIEDVSGENKNLQSTIEGLKNENNELKKTNEKTEFEKREAEVKHFLDEQASQGKVTPAQIPALIALALNTDEMTCYEYSENDKMVKLEYSDRIELVKQIVESSGNVNVEENSNHEERNQELYSNGKSDEDKTDSEIMEYAKEKKISVKEAIIEMGV